MRTAPAGFGPVARVATQSAAARVAPAEIAGNDNSVMGPGKVQEGRQAIVELGRMGEFRRKPVVDSDKVAAGGIAQFGADAVMEVQTADDEPAAVHVENEGARPRRAGRVAANRNVPPLGPAGHNPPSPERRREPRARTTRTSHRTGAAAQPGPRSRHRRDRAQSSFQRKRGFRGRGQIRLEEPFDFTSVSPSPERRFQDPSPACILVHRRPAASSKRTYSLTARRMQRPIFDKLPRGCLLWDSDLQ